MASFAGRVQNLGWGGVEEIYALQAFQLVEENNTRGAYKRWSSRWPQENVTFRVSVTHGWW